MWYVRALQYDTPQSAWEGLEQVRGEGSRQRAAEGSAGGRELLGQKAHSSASPRNQLQLWLRASGSQWSPQAAWPVEQNACFA